MLLRKTAIHSQFKSRDSLSQLSLLLNGSPLAIETGAGQSYLRFDPSGRAPGAGAT